MLKMVVETEKNNSLSQIDICFIAKELNELNQNEVLSTQLTVMEPDQSYLANSIEPAAVDNEKQKRERGQNREYQFCTTYSQIEEAEEVLFNEKIWSKVSGSSNKKGVVKITYRCNKSKYRSARCRSQGRIHFHPDSLEASIYRTYCEFYLNFSRIKLYIFTIAQSYLGRSHS